MGKIVIISDEAPAPIGPYSQAVKFNDLVFVSGQIAIDPNTGEFIEADISEQTRRIIKNISAILETADSSLGKIIKLSVFMKNLNDFSKVNEVFKEFLKGDFPARETVEVSRLPMDAHIEISAIAHI